MNRSLLFVATASAALVAGSSLAQGALKPVDALIVNGTSQPVPVAVMNQSTRTPYSFDDVGECNNLFCFFEYPTVPGGKRLVILHISGIARTQAPTVFDQAELISSNTETDTGARNYFAMTKIGRAGSGVLADTWGFNSPVLAFVKAGQAPRVEMATSVAMSGGFTFSQVTISGYLENAP